MEKDIINDLEQLEELEQKPKIKKIFKEICFDEFEDPNEEFTDVLYDLIPEDIIGNELKKIKGIKLKHGKFYSVEKIKKK